MAITMKINEYIIQDNIADIKRAPVDTIMDIFSPNNTMTKPTNNGTD